MSTDTAIPTDEHETDPEALQDAALKFEAGMTLWDIVKVLDRQVDQTVATLQSVVLQKLDEHPRNGEPNEELITQQLVIKAQQCQQLTSMLDRQLVQLSGLALTLVASSPARDLFIQIRDNMQQHQAELDKISEEMTDRVGNLEGDEIDEIDDDLREDDTTP